MKLSVIIPTLNCADGLGKTLESIKWVNEIIVVDMESTDGTLGVAKKYKAKIYHRVPKDGNFDLNRKFGMEKTNGDWILKLDSDEELSPQLQKEIQDFLVSDNGTINGFNVPNKIFMLGKQIKHGFVKNHSHELRLVRNGKWHYDPYKFHQQITVDGKVNFLKEYYLHHNFASVSEFFNKMNKYTSFDALETRKQNLLPILIPFFSLGTFIKLYIAKLGLLDGIAGLTVCYLFAIYNLTLKIKIWEETK